MGTPLTRSVGVYRNGAGDKSPAHKINVIVVSKTTTLSRSGRIYHAVFQSPDPGDGLFESPRSYVVDKKVYNALENGQGHDGLSETGRP